MNTPRWTKVKSTPCMYWFERESETPAWDSSLFLYVHNFISHFPFTRQLSLSPNLSLRREGRREGQILTFHMPVFPFSSLLFHLSQSHLSQAALSPSLPAPFTPLSLTRTLFIEFLHSWRTVPHQNQFSKRDRAGFLLHFYPTATPSRWLCIMSSSSSASGPHIIYFLL